MIMFQVAISDILSAFEKNFLQLNHVILNALYVIACFQI